MSPAELAEYFMSEGCATFALALHARGGYDLAVLFDDGQVDDWGRGPEPTPAHVFCIERSSALAVDARGRRPVTDVRGDFADLIEPRVEQLTRDDVVGLTADDRPLYRPDAETEEWAAQLVGCLQL